MKLTHYDGPCPIERVLNVFAGKWKPTILFHLEKNERLRFNEFRRLIPEITQRMLTRQLRELERDGLILREEVAAVPRKVEYSTTKLALSLVPLFQLIAKWGDSNMSLIENSRRCYQAEHGD